MCCAKPDAGPHPGPASEPVLPQIGGQWRLNVDDDNKGGLQAPQGKGESQGGAYPGQVRGPRSKRGASGFLGHGGQSVQAYQGGPNPNATSDEDEEGAEGEERGE